MATLSSSSAPNTAVTPMPSYAFKRALETYKKSLPQKYLTKNQMPTGPSDVVKDIEEWQLKQSKHKSRKVAAVVGNGLARLQRFTAAIDMIAQGTPAPGSLLWGGIKFVLVIVQDAVDEYEKLCAALSRMVEYLPWIEIYEETFMDSALVRDCVVDFYVSVIQFWTQASKSYRPHRLWRNVRKIWDNYDTEFGLLKTNMSINANKVKNSAEAENVRQEKSARTYQQAVSQSLLNTQNFSRKKNLARWLSPTAYEVDDYQDDFKAAIRKRHSESCQWLLNNAQFIQFSQSQISQAPLLWIYAKPGAGKTVLSSYLIDHYQQQRTNNMFYNVIYFFCKNSDEDKNNPTSIIRSLLYQLLEVIESPEYRGSLSDDMKTSMTKSGQHRALDFDTMWSLFAAHISKMNQPIVVLDALDECKKPKMLIQKLSALSKSNGIRVIVTSRLETHIKKLLAKELLLEIRSEDIDADIKAFIKAKVSKTPLLCENSVHDMIVDKLSAAHGGMFLWVYLILKELKVCKFVQQVQATLKKLPEGLPAIYANVLQRLCETLQTPPLELAKKMLVWVVSASRPLRVKEIQEALSFHYQMDGHQPIVDEQSFPYPEKDIELACGSLLTVREGTIQVIHLTVKEFLMDLTTSTNDSYKQLLVDPAAASLQLTLVSLDYISQRLTTPIFDLDAKTNRMDLKVDNTRLQDRRERNPFIEYASFNWPLHLIDCIEYKGDCSDKIAKAIRKTFDSSATFYWIEACLLLDSSNFLNRISSGLDELIEWASDEMDRAPSGSADLYEFLVNWCSVIVRIMHDYGKSIVNLPWDVYILDMREIFVSKGLGRLYNNYGNFKTRESVVLFSDDQSKTSPTVPNHLQIAASNVGAFIHDHVRKVFFIAESSMAHENLHVQEVETGRRLPPVVDPEDLDGDIESYAISKDGKYLCFLYNFYGRDSKMRISIWQLDSKIEFKKAMRSEPWAHKVFSEESPWNTMIDITVGYRDDGYFYSPIGRIEPTTNIVLRFPPKIFQDLYTPYPRIGNRRSLFFGAKGEVFFHEAGTKILKVYSLLEPRYAESHLPIATGTLCIRASPTGRYCLFQSEPGHLVYSLYDTTTKEVFEVHGVFSRRTRFGFSKDDSRLFCMASYDHPRRVEAFVFALNNGRPQICSEFQVELADTCELYNTLDYWKNNNIRDVCSDENTAWITKKQRIYQVGLGPPKVSFPHDLITDLSFRCHYFRISSDGTRLGVLHYGNNKAQIQTFDLDIPGNPVRCMDLNWPHCESEKLNIAFSKDLSVLVCGENLFHLAAEDSLASKSFPVFSPAPGQERFGHTLPKFDSYDDPSIFMSDDNPSVAYITYVVVGQPPLVHKVNLRSRCSARVDISGIDGFQMRRAILHPSLPLILLIPDNGSKGTIGADISTLDISTLDLNNRNVKRLSIPRRYRELDSCGDVPDIRFSECGTFIVYGDLRRSPKTVLLASLPVEPKPFRVIGVDETWHYAGYYRLFEGPGSSIGVRFSAIFRPTLDSSDPDVRDVDSGKLISSPSYVDAFLVYLLLGPTDDDSIRVLWLSKDKRPLGIRTIRLTFSELRARLIHEWELRNQKPFEPETVHVHPDAASAYVMTLFLD